VERVAVDLEDETPCAPKEVHLVRADPDIELGHGEAGLPDQGKDPSLRL
jgi:hypothetical protein